MHVVSCRDVPRRRRLVNCEYLVLSPFVTLCQGDKGDNVTLTDCQGDRVTET